MGNLTEELEKHHKCPHRYASRSQSIEIQARRLYIRDGPRGKQKFVSWGITCMYCGFVVADNPIEFTEQERKKELSFIKKMARAGYPIK